MVKENDMKKIKIAYISTTGLEVLQVLENQSYDVILMDIQMPELDGPGDNQGYPTAAE